jgi:hypothetical protein
MLSDIKGIGSSNSVVNFCDVTRAVDRWRLNFVQMNPSAAFVVKTAIKDNQTLCAMYEDLSIKILRT